MLLYSNLSTYIYYRGFNNQVQQHKTDIEIEAEEMMKREKQKSITSSKTTPVAATTARENYSYDAATYQLFPTTSNNFPI